VQTKFTPVGGHGRQVPYDANADLAEQVQQSFESSLRNLRTDYVDAYLLHGPYSHPDLVSADWEVWGAMEELYRSGRALAIGVSNVNAGQLEALVNGAEIRPMTVQNRCYAVRDWDRPVRDICGREGIQYQGFSLLTANPFVLAHPRILYMADRIRRTPEQIVYRFASAAGIVPLTGTTDEDHMREDLEIFEFDLTDQEIELIENINAYRFEAPLWA
jgi:diketogulonate reductase-like aldo/keto reductase